MPFFKPKLSEYEREQAAYAAARERLDDAIKPAIREATKAGRGADGGASMEWSVAGGVLALMLACAAAAADRISPLDTTCELHAMDKNGKPLTGAAKTSFIKACKQDMCEPKAIGKDGRPLAGAAKASFMKNCEEGR